ncbi:hypothetical protein AGLY_011155 [Aphis glycines]|uniref:Uncharacterized protein n=1 Tax=Aphis glycines TaxID=307491 RepID=A0A6G0TCM5_APHGL|nr:hypothetical protein AGLY_011155 [Aphis glycines]
MEPLFHYFAFMKIITPILKYKRKLLILRLENANDFAVDDTLGLGSTLRTNEIVSDHLICAIHTSLNSDHNSSWNFIRFQPSITEYKIQRSYPLFEKEIESSWYFGGSKTIEIFNFSNDKKKSEIVSHNFFYKFLKFEFIRNMSKLRKFASNFVVGKFVDKIFLADSKYLKN